MENKLVPKISVLMPVYNTKEEYLREAIDSILKQSFEEFELVIVDDASNDATKKVLASFIDPRIVIVENKENKGLAYALNVGLEKSRGEYIARMDSDDIAKPNRLKVSYEYMEQNSEVNIIGTYVDICGKVFKQRDELTSELRKALMMVVNVGPVHPSVMIRNSFLKEYGIKYDEAFYTSEDYDLWARCMEYTPVHIVPEVLLWYRVHEGQFSTVMKDDLVDLADLIKARMIKKTGVNYDIELLQKFIRSRKNDELTFGEYQKVLDDICASNKVSGYYTEEAMDFVRKWYLFKYLENHFKGVGYWWRLIGFALTEQGYSFIKLAKRYGVR